MTIRADYTAYCDFCGGDVIAGGIVDAAVLNVMMTDGRTRQFHACMRVEEGPGTHRCVMGKLLTSDNLSGFLAENPGGDFEAYVPAPSETEPPGVPQPNPNAPTGEETSGDSGGS